MKISLTELVAKGIPKEPGEINSYFLLSDTLTIDSVIISLPAFASSGLKVYPYKGAVDSQKFSIDPFNEYFYGENGKNERIYITCNVHGEIIEIK
ncbi:MAG TPA: hypothetical protein VK154_09670 [Chitinophagales bacterium]|nr:hypothetical protein [Chitinophagales bacterium]